MTVRKKKKGREEKMSEKTSDASLPLQNRIACGKPLRRDIAVVVGLVHDKYVVVGDSSVNIPAPLPSPLSPPSLARSRTLRK